MKFPLARLAALLPPLLLAASCDRFAEREPITESREISSHSRKPVADVPSASRFYDDASEEPESGGMNFRNLLTWTIPEGWAESAKPDITGMRLVDLRFGPNHEGECYVSLMPGAAGGLAANVNRWRQQLGQAPLSEEEIAKLEQKPFFNRDATFVTVDGDYKNVGAAEAQKDYRLLGLIHSAPQATIFVKLTGPKSLVEQNTAAFDAFCRSIKPNLPQE